MSLSSSAFLEVADRIGNRLCRDAIWSDDRCNWLGWTFVAQGATPVPGYRAQGVTLRDGVAGIALFLAWLHHFTGDPLHARTLHGALRQLARAIEDHADADSASRDVRKGPPLHPANQDGANREAEDRDAAARMHSDVLRTCGFDNGAAGVAATCIQIGELLRDDDWLARGLRVLDGIARDAARATARTTACDVASGVAGSIPVLLRLAARFDLPHFAIAAKRQADTLLEAARPSKDGGAWLMPDVPGAAGIARPFLGYAHGAGGMACALLELHRASGDERYRAAAIAALRDERRHLAAIGELGWSDGASSVACALLRASELLVADDVATLRAEIEAEADALLRTIAAHVADARPWAHTFCLYRGLAGCADVLLTGAERLGRPALRQAAETVGELGMVHFDRSRAPWPCGIPGVGGSPNLMLGLAGVGYFYLRLHQPHVVPTVLIVGDERPTARITTDRITTDRITADRITADCITADCIAATPVTADRITTDRATDRLHLESLPHLASARKAPTALPEAP